MSEAYYVIASSTLLIYLVFYVKKYIQTSYLYFCLYLFFMLSLDLTAYFVYDDGAGRDNLHIYNLLTFLEFNMLFLFYKQISKDALTKKVIKYVSYLFNTIYIMSALYYAYYLSFWSTYNSVAAISGSILMAIVLFLFYREMLLSDKVLNFKKEHSFWITLGLLVYYLGTSPVTSLLNYLKEKSIITLDDFTVIQFCMVTFMQACFIFGILWSYKKAK